MECLSRGSPEATRGWGVGSGDSPLEPLLQVRLGSGLWERGSAHAPVQTPGLQCCPGLNPVVLSRLVSDNLLRQP